MGYGIVPMKARRRSHKSTATSFRLRSARSVKLISITLLGRSTRNEWWSTGVRNDPTQSDSSGSLLIRTGSWSDKVHERWREYHEGWC
jgi:hypothetical protein